MTDADKTVMSFFHLKCLVWTSSTKMKFAFDWFSRK